MSFVNYLKPIGVWWNIITTNANVDSSRRLIPKILALVYCLAFLLVIAHHPALAAEPLLFPQIEEAFSEDIPVVVRAQTLEYLRAEKIYIAQGEVDIRYGDLQLQADRVELHSETGDALAEGGVFLQDKTGNQLSGEWMEINLRTQLGVIYQGRGHVEPYHYFQGEVIERLDQDKFRIFNGSYTACDQQVPDWSLHVDDALIQIERYAYLKQPSAYIRELPILWLPYAVLPIGTKRATGFLIPNLGHSSQKGPYIKNRFFWAPAEWWDATLVADYFEKQGLGGGAKVRYALTGEDDGWFSGYYLWDKEEERKRWEIGADMRQWFPYDIRGVLKLDFLSDRDYDRQFKDKIINRQRQEQSSYLWAIKNGSRYGLDFLAEYTKNLYQSEENKSSRLPELKAVAITQPLFSTPVYLRLETSYASLERNGDVDNFKFRRLDVHPEILLPLTISPRWVLTPSFGFRNTWYSENQEGDTENRGSYNFSFRMDGPQFFRTFSPGSNSKEEVAGLQEVKHIVKPYIKYTYQEAEDQDDLFFFDRLDRLPEQNLISYGLENHFLGRISSEDGGEKVGEALLVTLSQSYNIAEKRDPDQPDDPQPFSPLLLDIEFKPLGLPDQTTLRIDGELAYDFHKGALVRKNLDIWGGWRDTINVGLSWRNSDEPGVDVEQSGEVNYLGAHLEWEPISTLKLKLKTSYNLDLGGKVENRYSVTYQTNCWAVTLAMIDRFDEDEFTFNLDLTGIGSF